MHQNFGAITMVLESMHEEDGTCSLDVLVCVHGGLTYSDHRAVGICNTQEEAANSPVWWLGFDCGHCYDYQPGLMKDMPDIAWDTQYRDVEYVQGECRNLAEQVARSCK